ncbi:hypothetical protein [Allorhizobium undicola]|uniref:hypothetical protein n=1 Tax=Allorhizobium undicola TaxID=78527 RepID=UPI0012B5A6A4|nr:hypothetical protein [Allorhizobium undicola]
MAEATKAVDLSKAISQFAGEERKALEALDRRNAEARKVLSAYADELEDAAYLMQKCAR